MNPQGIITAFGLAPAGCDERPIGEFLVTSDHYGAFLADKDFSWRSSESGTGWKRRR